MNHHKYYNKYIKYKKKYKIEGGAGNDNNIHDMCDNCDVHQSYENFRPKMCFNNLRDDCCGIQRNSQECREWVSYTVDIKSKKTDMDKKLKKLIVRLKQINAKKLDYNYKLDPEYLELIQKKEKLDDQPLYTWTDYHEELQCIPDSKIDYPYNYCKVKGWRNSTEQYANTQYLLQQLTGLKDKVDTLSCNDVDFNRDWQGLRLLIIKRLDNLLLITKMIKPSTDDWNLINGVLPGYNSVYSSTDESDIGVAKCKKKCRTDTRRKYKMYNTIGGVCEQRCDTFKIGSKYITITELQRELNEIQDLVVKLENIVYSTSSKITTLQQKQLYSALTDRQSRLNNDHCDKQLCVSNKKEIQSQIDYLKKCLDDDMVVNNNTRIYQNKKQSTDANNKCKTSCRLDNRLYFHDYNKRGSLCVQQCDNYKIGLYINYDDFINILNMMDDSFVR